MASPVANTTSSKRCRLLLLAAAVALTILVPPVSAQWRPVRLRVYVQEVLDGPGQTEKLLLRGPGPANPSLWPPHNYFGDTVVMDDLVTEGPANDSAPVGRVYGIYMTASMSRPVYTVSFTLLLSTGPYKGSTLVMAGIDDDSMPVREHAVVGGTGALRGAQGYVLGVVMPVSSQYVVMELDVHASVPEPTNKAKAAASHLIMDL
ncbi:hypothetical protein PAHAL_4G316500 [Panicum hallii]|jgi:hypothetical protein|uniref:Dirigent protein n=1 Tax=Panicum hallii TaxID=206008 RepID=A0A2S3HLL4_9POAL|nr:dirigent protein 1-like [Panicum hallii]PAN25662.1 hypothetical protein PAHAL_4G316500 [Panicum hallii]